MLDASKTILGTSQFGSSYGHFARSQATYPASINRVLSQCYKKNIRQIDTAPVYGDFFDKEINLEKFVIDTKVHFPDKTNLRRDFFSAIQTTVSSLSKNTINVLYLHNPQILFDDKNAMNYVNQLFIEAKNNQLIEHVGVSIYDISEIEKIIDSINVDVIQLPINFVDGRFREKMSMFEALKKSKSISIYARSIFLQGILLNLNSIPASMRRHAQSLNKVNTWLKRKNVKALDACIGFVQNNSIIDKFIIGVQDEAEIKKILCAKPCNIPMDDYPKIFDKNLLDPRQW